MNDKLFDILENSDSESVDFIAENFADNDIETMNRTFKMSERKYRILKKNEETAGGVEQYKKPVLSRICGIAACLALLTGGIGVGIYLFRDNSHPHTEYSDETNIQASDITTSAVTDAVEVITQSDDEPDFHFENVDRVRLVPFMNDTAIYELPQEETEILTEVLSKAEYVRRTAPMADEWVGFYVFNSGEPYMLYFHEDGSFYLHYNDIFCTYQLPQEEFQKLTNMSFGSFYNLDVSELEMFQHEYPFIDDTIAKSVWHNQFEYQELPIHGQEEEYNTSFNDAEYVDTALYSWKIVSADDEERNSLENKSYIKYMLTNCWDYFNTVQGNYERTFDGYSHTVEFCVDKTAEYKRETWSDDNIEWTDYCYENTLYSVAEHEKRFIANYEYYGNETLGELDIRDEIIHMKFAHLVVQPFLAAILLEDFDCWEITDTQLILNRECAIIEGYDDSSEFKITVDLKTGFVYEFCQEGTDDTTMETHKEHYIVNDIQINTPTDNRKFDSTGYTEIFDTQPYPPEFMQ